MHNYIYTIPIDKSEIIVTSAYMAYVDSFQGSAENTSFIKEDGTPANSSAYWGTYTYGQKWYSQMFRIDPETNTLYIMGYSLDGYHGIGYYSFIYEYSGLC